MSPLVVVKFQFTHPGKGATPTQRTRQKRAGCFNSRTLGRVRLIASLPARIPALFQFTHPGKGATSDVGKPERASVGFQFTHPGKGATPASGSSIVLIYRFQFTHPGKGATSSVLVALSFLISFNSRTLGRVRHNTIKEKKRKEIVSIHAPWEGCDSPFSVRAVVITSVSIHAPWEGCDLKDFTA